jgi:hypothetical protein
MEMTGKEKTKSIASALVVANNNNNEETTSKIFVVANFV